jgi:hypothetical protein
VKARNIPTVKLTPRDVKDTPEGFEDRFDARRPRPKPHSPLKEPERSNMSELLDRFGIPRNG